MKRITSFSVDHDYITPGMYVSRIDGNITTYDLRTRKPNAGDYMDSVTMHSMEHQFATFVRNSEYGDKVIYFGPMGCRTGFYLLLRDMTNDQAYSLVCRVLMQIAAHRGEVYGASRKECGNYSELSNDSAVSEARRYLEVLQAGTPDFEYPKGE